MVEIQILNSREEWLRRRTSYIGGSDAAAVIGMNPYKTNVDLYREKIGLSVPEDISDRPYVRYGTEAEEHLRELFKLDFPQFDVRYVDNNMWTNDSFPWAHASLDGWITDKATGRKGILEIKTTEILRSQQKEKWKDRIPDNYYLQVLHYLMVTEFDFVILKGQLKTVFDGLPYLQTKHYIINREDVEEDIAFLIEAERTFADHIRTRTEPALILPEI